MQDPKIQDAGYSIPVFTISDVRITIEIADFGINSSPHFIRHGVGRLLSIVRTLPPAIRHLFNSPFRGLGGIHGNPCVMFFTIPGPS